MNGVDVLGTARIRGAVTGTTWQLTGSVGMVQLDSAESFALSASGNLDRFRANQANDLKVSAGLAATALDDGTVASGEVLDETVTILDAQIGRRRGDGGTAAGVDVILAAPIFNRATFREVDDLGTDDGSALWLSDAESIARLQSSNTSDADMNWTYMPGQADPWPVDREPLELIS